MFLSTPTEILSLLGYFFDWIFSKPFWLQAIQISNLVLSIYNVVASGPLLKLQQVQYKYLDSNLLAPVITACNLYFHNNEPCLFFDIKE